MNIKLKAVLLTVAGFFGLFATLFTIVEFPLVLLLITLGGLLYVVYRGVLNYLEHEEKRTPR
jgi:arginine exporter protein ArgO